jgi:hypothetical protein
MDAINRKSQRQVDSIIDEEAGVLPMHEREESLHQSIKVPSREILLAELDGFRPTGTRGIHHHLERPPSG